MVFFFASAPAGSMSCPWSLERPAHRALPAPTGTAAPASARAPWPLVPAAACSVRPGAAAHGCTARLRWLGPAADGANAPWSFTGTPWQACNRRNGVHALLEHLGVMSVCPANQDHQRDASGVYDDVPLGAEFSSVGGVRACFLAPRGLGTEEPSILARLQSIWSCSRKRISMAWCNLCQTPAALQFRSRRQQVMPLP